MHEQKNKNWWGRNWKWFVPFGCLGSLILFIGFIGLIIFFVFSMMKSSGAYKDAVAIAKDNITIQKEIGTPIEEGFFVTGNITINGPSGQANLTIPISGPDGKAVVYVVAEKSAGTWAFSTLTAKIKKTNQRIDLLELHTEKNETIDSN